MAYRNYLKILLKIIALITIVSGLVQMLVPELVLGTIGGEVTGSTLHFFGIIGMFMVLFGGLLLQALGSIETIPLAIFWCALQKYGAAIAVGLAVVKGLLSWFALWVAGFDLISGILIMVHWYAIKDR